MDDVEDVEGLNQDCRAIRTATLMSLPELLDFKVENVYDMFPDPYPEYQTNANSPTDPDLKVVHFKQKYIDNYSQL